jgi:two-component SAPR family response regulator
MGVGFLLIILKEDGTFRLPAEILRHFDMRTGVLCECSVDGTGIRLIPLEDVANGKSVPVPDRHCPAPDDHRPVRLSLRCFGRLTLQYRGRYVRIDSERARELLALLVVEDGRPMRKERLSGILWPDSTGELALDCLYKAIRSLRRLEEQGVSIPIVCNRNEVFLETGDIEIDTVMFEALYGDGTKESFERAVPLYVAPFLADEYYEWTSSHQAFYEVMFHEIIERLTQHYRDAHNPQKQRYYSSLMERM